MQAQVTLYEPSGRCEDFFSFAFIIVVGRCLVWELKLFMDTCKRGHSYWINSEMDILQECLNHIS
jgi:hypothetical protein